MAESKIKVFADRDAEVALEAKIFAARQELSQVAEDPQNPGAAEGKRNQLRTQIDNDSATLARMRAVPEPNLQTQPQQNTQQIVAPTTISPAPGMTVMQGASAMFKSPETLQKIAELMSAADSGKPIESIMEEIQKATGLEGEAFWKELHAFVKEAEGNPFVDGAGSKSEEKSDDKESDDDKEEKKESPFEKKEDEEDKEEGDEKEESEDEDHDEAKKEDKKHEKMDKKMDKMLDDMIELGEKLLEMEEGEGEPHAGDIMQAINILKQFQAEEKAEHGEGKEDMAKLEKEGPDLPPAMEGMAVPLPEAEEGMPGEMKVIEIETKTPLSPAFASQYRQPPVSEAEKMRLTRLLKMDRTKEEEAELERLRRDFGKDKTIEAPYKEEVAKAKMSEKGKEFVGKKMKKMKEEKGKGKKFAPKQEIAIALSEADRAGFKEDELQREADEMPSAYNPEAGSFPAEIANLAEKSLGYKPTVDREEAYNVSVLGPMKAFESLNIKIDSDEAVMVSPSGSILGRFKKGEPDLEGHVFRVVDESDEKASNDTVEWAWQNYQLGAITYKDYSNIANAAGVTPKPELGGRAESPSSSDAAKAEAVRKYANFNIEDELQREADEMPSAYNPWAGVEVPADKSRESREWTVDSIQDALTHPAWRVAYSKDADDVVTIYNRHNDAEVYRLKKMPDGKWSVLVLDDLPIDWDEYDTSPRSSDAESSFNLHDRVWRKADFEQQFETVGDEPGRVIALGGGKVIVDWGDFDGIPTEELPEELVLASSASTDGLFELPKMESFHDENDLVGSPTGVNEVADELLKQTSLHEMLARAHKEFSKDPETVRHIASGKSGKVIERMADSQMKILVDGREFVVWNYEVE